MTQLNRSEAVSESQFECSVSSISDTYLENKSFLHKFLARFFSSRQDIEDVAQEAFLRAYVAEQDKEIEQPKAFLFRIAKNVALTKLTKKSVQITDYIEDCSVSIVIDDECSTEKEVEAEQKFGLYCEAVAGLGSKSREVFLLRKVHGLSHKEIADRMSLSISSVEKYLRQSLLECDDFFRQHEQKQRSEPVVSQVLGGR